MAFIEMCDIVKIYPNGVVANDEVNFSVERGEIHALVGENGAGKSTLMKLLYGMTPITSGEILLDGKPVQFNSSRDAISAGIGMVHQNFMLVPSFTVAQNIVLGHEPTKGSFLDAEEAVLATEELSKRYGLHVDATAVVESINVGMRQRVEILKTLYRGAQVLILDEPTAVLTPQETKELFLAVHKLVKGGKTVIFITHKLREVKEISDRVTVMRRGKVVDILPTSKATRRGLARMMVGREVFLNIDRPPIQRGDVALKVENLSYISEIGRLKLQNLDFNLYYGEILGVAGVEGNGQTELAEVLSGLCMATTGSAVIDGKNILNTTVRNVRLSGLSHIPEDRLTNGVAVKASIFENLIIDRYFKPDFLRGFSINYRKVFNQGKDLIKEYDIRTTDGSVSVGVLSGGNMQKVVIAREFSSNPKILIAAQPTRGIDVGSTEFVRRKLVQKRVDGSAVLLISADLSEVMSISDRIIVVYEGQITNIVKNTPELTEEEIGYYMLGLKQQDPEEMRANL